MRLRSLFAMVAMSFSIFSLSPTLAAEPGDWGLRQAIYHDYDLQPAIDIDISGLIAFVNVTAEERTVASLSTPDDKTIAKVNRFAIVVTDEWAPEVVRFSARRSV